MRASLTVGFKFNSVAGLSSEALIAGEIFRGVAWFQTELAVIDAKLDRRLSLACMWGRKCQASRQSG